MAVEFAPGARVVRVATGDYGLVLAADGEYREVEFAEAGRATIHADDLRPAPTDPLERLIAGDFGNATEYGLRLQARYLKHAYKYDPLSGLSNARIEPMLHQVYVAHRVGQKLRPRMILADEVGLGKTIEAGLIMKEMIARGTAERILIICPASLQFQWQSEMRGKFNEEFTILDGEAARLLGRDGSNPWLKVDRVITSLPLARREERSAQIIESEWDLVIFDEAHHVRRRYEGPGKYRSTLAYELADELKELTDGLLLLTATPMQLHPFELYSLIELVEPGLYPSFESYDTQRKTLPALNGLMRDLRIWDALAQKEQMESIEHHSGLLEELGLPGDPADYLAGSAARDDLMDELVAKHPLSLTLTRNRKAVIGGFASRSPYRIPVTPTEQETSVYENVSAYIREGYNRARRDKNNAVGFLMVLYHKLLASSSNALRSSFKKRIEKLRVKVDEAEAFELGELSEADIEELAGSDDVLDVIEELEDYAANREAALWEIEVLERLVSELGGLRDSKAEALVSVIADRILKDHPDEKILVFTGFLKTQEFLAYALKGAGYEVVLFNGQMDIEEKERSVRDFRKSAQIMITTEAGGEGRNFQFAHIMVNYDLPWNPMKVEQRIGRLDRIGQSKEVLIYNLAVEGTVEDRVLDVLDRRIGLFEESVGSLDPILGEVERDLERLVMEHSAHLDEEIEDYGKDLGVLVAEARQKERLLADFILDRASLRTDEAAELLEDDPLARWTDLRDYISDSLSYFGGRLSEHQEGGYSVSLSPKLSLRLGIKKPVNRGIFDPKLALEMEDLPFLAFGHEIVDSLVAYGSDSDAMVAARRDENAPSGTWVEVFYELESEGVRPSGRMVHHLVGQDLSVIQSELTKLPKLDGESAELPVPQWAADAVAASQRAIRVDQERLREHVVTENEGNKADELERAARIHQYRRHRLQRVIADGEAWLTEKEISGTEGEKRVLPARRGKVARDRERLKNLEAESEARKLAIEETRADVQLRVVAAGLVVGS